MSASRKVKVLVVEDEAMLGLLLSRSLRRLGYEVGEPIASGEEALRMAEQEQPDVVLMDIRLAGAMDGIEAAREITARYGTPIIFMTGYSDDEIKARTDSLKPAGYLVKPITPADVEPVITALFQ